MTRIILLMLAGMLAGCGSTPAPRLPQALEQAQTADKDARRALRNGELLRAQYNFTKALALQQSLDDTAGAATTLINLATVTHQLHDDAAALVWLDRILLERAPLYPAEARMTAAFRKAVILTNMARPNEAEAALSLAEKQCEKKCALHFGMDVLHARLLLLKGDAAGALALAQSIAKEKGAGKEEQANAVRVAAAAEEKLQHYANALQYYQSALETDKALGLSARIGEDLSGMARAAKLLGQLEDANLYARRAELVNASQRQNAPAVQ